MQIAPHRFRRIASPCGGRGEASSPVANDIIEPHAFVFRGRYTIRLTATDEDALSAYGQIDVTINAPPTSGKCPVTPAVGYALETDFTFRCSSWVDDDLPLHYVCVPSINGPFWRDLGTTRCESGFAHVLGRCAGRSHALSHTSYSHGCSRARRLSLATTSYIGRSRHRLPGVRSPSAASSTASSARRPRRRSATRSFRR